MIGWLKSLNDKLFVTIGLGLDDVVIISLIIICGFFFFNILHQILAKLEQIVVLLSL